MQPLPADHFGVCHSLWCQAVTLVTGVPAQLHVPHEQVLPGRGAVMLIVAAITPGALTAGQVRRPGPGIGALPAGASTLTVVAACAGQPPGRAGIHARRHAGHPRARRPAVIPGSELPGNCRGWSSPAKARGCDPHLPDLAGCDTETRGCGNLPAAMRSWRQRPGGALTISLAPSAEALRDALVGNGRRLPAIMRPPAAPAGR